MLTYENRKSNSDLDVMYASIDLIIQRSDGQLWEIEKARLKGQSCLWTKAETRERKDLKVLAQIQTFHSYGAPSFFKPTLEELFHQIPVEYVDQVAAIRVGDAVGIDSKKGCHFVTTILYSSDSESRFEIGDEDLERMKGETLKNNAAIPENIRTSLKNLNSTERSRLKMILEFILEEGE